MRDLTCNRYAALVGKTGEESTHAIGGELIDVRGDDAPGALDEELHREGAEDEQRRNGGERPHWNGEQRATERDADRASPAQTV